MCVLGVITKRYEALSNVRMYCDKRHPVMCSYFETYEEFKFSSFCEYNLSERIYNNFERDVEILKKEISDSKQV